MVTQSYNTIDKCSKYFLSQRHYAKFRFCTLRSGSPERYAILVLKQIRNDIPIYYFCHFKVELLYLNSYDKIIQSNYYLFDKGTESRKILKYCMVKKNVRKYFCKPI